MRLIDEQNYIICDFDLETRSFHISFAKEADLTDFDWGETTRLSPVWPIDLSEYSVEGADSTSDVKHICFLGPASPVEVVSRLQTDLLSKLPPRRMWLSLGFFNFILLISNHEELHLLTEFCESNDCRMEFWRVSGPSDKADMLCEEVHFYNGVDKDDLEANGTVNRINGSKVAVGNVASAIDASIKQAFTELHSLKIATHTRSASKFDVFSRDLSELERHIPELEEVLVDQGEEAQLAKQNRNLQALRYRDNILGVNAGLSRMVSQAFSGASPIYQSECHAWPHSFLGLGMANLALRNLTSFMFEELNDLNVNSLYFENLASPFEIQEDDESEPTNIVSAVQPRAFKARLKINANQTDEKLNAGENEIPNPITYFSGRDGFRFGTFTQSAPLLSVHGCNSSQWTLGTISHEISHRFVSPKLRDLNNKLQHKFDSESETEILRYLKEGCSTKMDASLKLILHGLLSHEGKRLGPTNFEIAIKSPADFIRSAISEHAREIEEILVHIFDFVHFYNSDPTTYVTSVWRSWAVQPSISQNFERYIFRTSAALATLKFQDSDWIEQTSSRFTTIVDKYTLNTSTMKGQDIQDFLSENSVHYDKRLRRLSDLICLFYTLFNFPEVGPRLAHDGRNTGRASWLTLHDDSGTSFPNFENPLKFARDIANETTPNGAKSAWLLTALACRFEERGS